MSELEPTVHGEESEHDWRKISISVAGLSAIGMLGLAFKLVHDQRKDGEAETGQSLHVPEQPNL